MIAEFKSNSCVIQPSTWARLFFRVGTNYTSAEIESALVSVRSEGCCSSVSYEDIDDIKIISGWIWDRLVIVLDTDNVIVLGGLSKLTSSRHKKAIIKKQETFFKVKSLISNRGHVIKRIGNWISRGLNGEFWVANSELSNVTKRVGAFELLLDFPIDALTEDTAIVQSFELMRALIKDPKEFRNSSNERFIEAENRRFGHYFDTVEENPLTESQRLAVITHEDNTRVIAGAGSGKTSVIVAKAGYLRKKNLCSEEELLLLAFNRDAANEISGRIKQKLGEEVKVSTFHALGLQILAQVEKKKPALSKFVENRRALHSFIRETIANLVLDPKYSNTVRSYFQSYFAPYRSQFEFETLGEYYEYIKSNEILTLKGEVVKSYEEVEIANYLCLNGINYEYEKSYEVDTATISRRQYKPDFYLVDSGIYIEHFGVNRDGSTPPFMDSDEYKAAMKWKRELHKLHGTRLIETYSYEKREGTLLQGLEERLQLMGVLPRPISPDEALSMLNKESRIDQLSVMTATFLNHFKGGGHSVSNILGVAKERSVLDDRIGAFMRIFSPLFDCYEKKLKTDGEIDFNDMIVRAAHYVEVGKYISHYACILVDEFQDISAGRARLLKALASQSDNYRLFCVGDDWQSIYRFAGSDIAFMRDFEDYFGFTETVSLDYTFRFNDRIEKVATRFILSNPSQIEKKIKTTNKATGKRVIIDRPMVKGHLPLIEILKEIAESSHGYTAKVLLLGRYNFIGDGIPWKEMNTQCPDVSINFKTVHSAKGLEADYVIVLGLQSGKYGFPSEINDDAILEIVLAEPEGFSHAEERRLLYVAVTRAKEAVYLMADYLSPSSFIYELSAYKDDVLTRGVMPSGAVFCPNCQSGVLVQRTSSYGTFYSCSNYPLCEYKSDACKYCGTGLLVPDDNRTIYTCNNENCNHTEIACPQCKIGRLVERNGQYGIFLGCTNYSKGGCRHTQRI